MPQRDSSLLAVTLLLLFAFAPFPPSRPMSKRSMPFSSQTYRGPPPTPVIPNNKAYSTKPGSPCTSLTVYMGNSSLANLQWKKERGASLSTCVFWYSIFMFTCLMLLSRSFTLLCISSRAMSCLRMYSSRNTCVALLSSCRHSGGGGDVSLSPALSTRGLVELRARMLRMCCSKESLASPRRGELPEPGPGWEQSRGGDGGRIELSRGNMMHS
ncbi:hypothetical protein INR49_021309 [Caranx melampygus]|nr:hypothetical protein INR49_021309 [Caranx melampygus]